MPCFCLHDVIIPDFVVKSSWTSDWSGHYVCSRARAKIKKREGGSLRESVCGSQLLVDELKCTKKFYFKLSGFLRPTLAICPDMVHWRWHSGCRTGILPSVNPDCPMCILQLAHLLPSMISSCLLKNNTYIPEYIIHSKFS